MQNVFNPYNGFLQSLSFHVIVLKSQLGGNGRRKKLKTEIGKKRIDRKRSEGKSRLWKSGDGCDFQ